uniref:NmrA-like family domain-containing protein 1 n=2 Tax=Catharus ustulatus TaxID=91951 RepID=A0A8C3US77_CATUS
TRSPGKKEAEELRRRGAEVVKADQDDEASLERALAGAYGAFIVTDFWDHRSKEKEIEQGQRLADLSKRQGLHHVVFSGLENVHKLTGGKLEVLHYDSKGVVEEYFQKIGVPTTIIRLPFYFENFLTALKPQKRQGDAFVLELPMGDAPMDAMAVEDLGPIVLSLLKSPGEYIGQVIGLSTGKLTEAEYAAVLSQQTGKNVTASKITPEEWEKRDFPGGKQTANMFRFYALMPDRNNVALTMKLNPKARTFQQWAGDNKNFL